MFSISTALHFFVRPVVSRTTMRREYVWALMVVLVSSFVSFSISFHVGLFILFFAVVGWWAWEHADEGFLLLLVLAPVLPMFKMTQTISLITLIKDVIIAVLFVRFFLLPLFILNLPHRRDILFVPLSALLFWIVIELLRADTPALGILRAREIVLYILLYFAVLYFPWSVRFVRRCAIWFLLGTFVVLLLAVYQWFFAVDSTVLRYDPAARIWIPRLSSTLAHPSVFGQYLITFATLCSAGILVFADKRWRMILALLFVMLIPFVYLTYSRAVWFGLFSGLFAQICLYLTLRLQLHGLRALVWKRIGLTAALGLLALFLIVRFTATGVFVRSVWDPTYASNLIRFEYAIRLLASMTATEAFVGKGLGDVLAQQLRVVDLETQDIAAGSAREVQLAKDSTLVDNQHLKTFVEMGIAGLVIYGWLYWKTILASRSLAVHDRSSQQFIQKVLGWWGIGFFTAFVVQGFFIDIWDIFPTNMSFWIVAALISAHWNTASS